MPSFGRVPPNSTAKSQQKADQADAAKKKTAGSPATFCNPLPIPNYPIGRAARTATKGSPDSGASWLLGHQEQFRELADPVVLWHDGKWYLYSHNEGYGSSNNNAPLPIELRNNQVPATLTLPIWEPVKSGTAARLRLVLFQHVESDEVSMQLNGAALKHDVVDPQWKDPRIFSPDPQPATVTPGALVKNTAVQKLTRLEFIVSTEILKRGENSITISVNRKGPFPPSKFVKVEKVKLHLKP